MFFPFEGIDTRVEPEAAPKQGVLRPPPSKLHSESGVYAMGVDVNPRAFRSAAHRSVGTASLTPALAVALGRRKVQEVVSIELVGKTQLRSDRRITLIPGNGRLHKARERGSLVEIELVRARRALRPSLSTHASTLKSTFAYPAICLSRAGCTG